MFFFSKPTLEAQEYPYNATTFDPKKQKHEFNGANFTYVMWPSTLKDEASGEVITKARMLIVHGFDEHTQLYSRFMDNLSAVGIESFIFDQRGSGETSPGKLKGQTNEFHTFNDLDHFLEWNLKDKDAATPLFLFGHSMGGGICLNYGCNGRYKDQVAGITVTGPLVVLHPHTQPRAIVRLCAPVLAAALPRLRIDTGLDIDATTSDQRFRDFLRHDPLTMPVYGTLRQIYDFMERGKRLIHDKAHLSRFDRPVLVLHGQDDRINDPQGSQSFHDLCPVTDKTLNFYPAARHSLCLETDSVFEQVFRDLSVWVLHHCDDGNDHDSARLRPAQVPSN
ncbi:LAFE_0F07712g1_1 [Lachancea fermentati]|uniref:LAFE_0F07712g1_1 n=1 Tax=Lachancea fermentati TaxID=4955 RepID=A0A1G4MEZ2_LACFM|nr:LAFE_0F07712g1_1 [Lachancea fermentati]